MSLEVYIGPMWAGKSSTVLGTLRRYSSIGWKVLVITSKLDNRYSPDMIVSHDKEQYPAIAVDELRRVTHMPEYQEAQLIMIDEAQFFPDLLEFTLVSIDKYQKHVVVVGLDGDSDRKPFGQILQLIPHCDSVKKITSFCSECRDGTPALFSFHKAHKSGQVSVGHQNQYEPLCRQHYNKKTREKQENE